MRISDWSSDVCSSDLIVRIEQLYPFPADPLIARLRRMVNLDEMVVAVAQEDLRLRRYRRHPVAQQCADHLPLQIGRASCRARVCPYVSISVVAVALKKKQNIAINAHSTLYQKQ